MKNGKCKMQNGFGICELEGFKGARISAGGGRWRACLPGVSLRFTPGYGIWDWGLGNEK